MVGVGLIVIVFIIMLFNNVEGICKFWFIFIVLISLGSLFKCCLVNVDIKIIGV